MRAKTSLCLVICLLSLHGDSWAQVPLPPSIEVIVPGAYVRTSPGAQGSRKGTLGLGARFRPLKKLESSGCDGFWYQLGPEAWVCSRYVATSAKAPHATQLPVVAKGQIVPHQYGFAAKDGARLYASLELAEAEDWDREFDPRNGLHLAKLVQYNGRQYYRLVKGGYVPAAEVIPARPSNFAGQKLSKGQRVGWVKRRNAPVRVKPGKTKVVTKLGKRVAVDILERAKKGKTLWIRIGEKQWIRGSHLWLPTEATPPPHVGAKGRWIDVDTKRQILTAYEGKAAVFSTLISSVLKGSATPRGIFRVWAKLETGDMSGGTETIDDNPYLMQGVPWVMYFNEGVALHGAYWHDDFGRRKSHGCVNLAPQDAAFLFFWSSPVLPPGWTGVLPTSTEPGTVVVVR